MTYEAGLIVARPFLWSELHRLYYVRDIEGFIYLLIGGGRGGDFQFLDKICLATLEHLLIIWP